MDFSRAFAACRRPTMTNLGSPTIAVPPAADAVVSVAIPQRPAAADVVRPAGRMADGVGRAAFDGLAWTFRNGFDRLLARVPAGAWIDPARQPGWERVKHNATRDVWRGRIGDQLYYAKYYARSGWRAKLKGMLRGPACLAEWNCGIYALHAGIAAVRPAGYTPTLCYAGRTCSLLVTEAVEPSQPLNEFWRLLQSDNEDARRRADTAQLAERLAELIARAHQSGFEHLDMHAANILVQPVAPREYRTVFVDLHTARLGTPIDDRAVVRNLAQLNQWFRRHSSLMDRLRFLRAYFRWRNEYEHAFAHARPLGLTFEQLVRALRVGADRHADRLWNQRDRRAARKGRYFSRVRVRGGWRGMVYLTCKQPLDESPLSRRVLTADWWKHQLREPLHWFEGPQRALCKDSHSAQVARAALPHPDGDVPVIIKRPLARNWRRALSQLLPPSRSVRGWRVGNALLHRDIAVARPLAVLERRRGPFVRDSLLITEAIPNAMDLDQHLRAAFRELRPRAWVRHKRELTRLLVRHVRRLEDRGFAHRDCKAGNLLVVREPRLALLWIDMDGLRLLPPRDREPGPQLVPLTRLHVSLLEAPGLTRTDRVRFLRDYCSRFGGTPDAWRAVWRALERSVRDKLTARKRRRAWKRRHYGRE
jgi:tRNA A-37 threonylcarbamoyl transferase component Bud32